MKVKSFLWCISAAGRRTNPLVKAHCLRLSLNHKNNFFIMIFVSCINSVECFMDIDDLFRFRVEAWHEGFPRGYFTAGPLNL